MGTSEKRAGLAAISRHEGRGRRLESGLQGRESKQSASEKQSTSEQTKHEQTKHEQTKHEQTKSEAAKKEPK